MSFAGPSGLSGGVVAIINWDLSMVAEADAATVDVLARLQLTARRVGYALRLRNPSPELLELLDFMGLRDVLGVEPRGQAEEREDRLRVEEEGELGDPPA